MMMPNAAPQLAAIQMVSGPDLKANLAQAGELLDQAASTGARLAVLPENFAFMGLRDTDKLALAEADGDGPIQAFLSKQARRHRLWLVGGTIPLRGGGERARAACLVFDDTGRRVARYDKIHLFDVQVGEESYRESATLEPGDAPVLVETPFGRLGLAVCYDLRFPELFRRLAGQGMEILALPAAFTAVTGAAHWEVLLRARAIENLCYVVAAAQGGRHAGGRETFGDSMIVDPWGAVLARRPQQPGVVTAAVDLERLTELRRRFPALDHRRLG